MGAGASVVTKEEVEKLPQYTILGGKSKLVAQDRNASFHVEHSLYLSGDAKFDEMKDGEGKVSIEKV